MNSYTLLPADSYIVCNKTILGDFDKKILISFYEAIVGHLAISLYLTLWNDLDNENMSRELTHHHLMSILKCPLRNLKEAREGLEAVGLIRTYVKEGDINNYIYEMYSPLSPSEFFNHPILNIVLYNNIGASEYDRLRKAYQKPKFDLKSYSDITKSIDEVYTSVSEVPHVEDAIDRSVCDITCKDQVDFDLIISSIPKGIINEKAFNKKTKELINELAFIYKLDSLKMVDLIRSVLNEYGMIDKNSLRLAARKSYQYNNNALPTMIYRSQPEYLKTPNGDTSMRGKIIEMFENINPVDFLRIKNGGTKPTNREIKIIEMLIVDMELPPAVVNVLLDYILRKENNKLVPAYIEAIAGQWKRANLKTAADAMEFAKKEHKKLTKKEPTKVSKEPAWFDKDLDSQKMSEEDQNELNNLLKEFL